MKKFILIVITTVMLLLCAACGVVENEPEVINRTFVKYDESEGSEMTQSFVFSSDGHAKYVFSDEESSFAIAGEYKLKDHTMTLVFDDEECECCFRIFGDIMTLSDNSLASSFGGKYICDHDSSYQAKIIPYIGKTLSGNFKLDEYSALSFKEDGTVYIYDFTKIDRSFYYNSPVVCDVGLYEISDGVLMLNYPGGDPLIATIETNEDGLYFYFNNENYASLFRSCKGELFEKESLLEKYLTAAYEFDCEHYWYTDGIAPESTLDDFEYLGEVEVDGDKCYQWHCIIDNPYIGDWSIYTQYEFPYRVYNGYSPEDADLICENGVVALDDSPIDANDFSDGPDQG